MRDPKRIPKVLDQLRDYWTTHPDLRFFQVVEHMKTRVQKANECEDWGDFDPFYTKDEQALEVLERMNKSV